MSPNLLVDIDTRGVATLTMNRPEVHNAFDEALIEALTRRLATVGSDSAVRAVVLRGAGKSFSAGADIHWMKRAAAHSEQENYEDALRFAELMRTLDCLPKPTLAVVHGHVMGGGVGLCCACDIVLAAEDARFSISEVRLGILPAVIGPYVVNALGRRQARRLMMSAERLDAAAAQALGLAHITCVGEAPDRELQRQLGLLLGNGPEAVVEAKRIALALAPGPVTPEVIELTARTISRVRAGAEARAGFAAFFDKRPPPWAVQV